MNALEGGCHLLHWAQLRAIADVTPPRVQYILFNLNKKVSECPPGVEFSSKNFNKCLKMIKFIQKSTQERGVQTGANALSALAKGRLAYPSANTGVISEHCFWTICYLFQDFVDATLKSMIALFNSYFAFG